MRWLVALVVLAALAPAPGERNAAAEPPRAVALVGISGPNGPALTALLEYGLVRRFAFVKGDDYRAAAVRLGATGPSPREVRAVALDRRVDAVLAGATRRRPDRALQFRVVVRDGASGEVMGHVDRVLVDGMMDEGERDDVCDELRRMVAGASGWRRLPVTASPDALPPTSEPSPPDREDDAAFDAPPAAVAPVAAIPAVSLERRLAPSARDPLSADAGLELLARRLGVDAPATRANGGGTALALGVHGLFFPFAYARRFADEHPVLSALGLELALVASLPFGSQPSSGPSVPSRALRWDAALAGRIPLGRSALTLGVGYGELGWTSDDPTRLGVPDVTYRYVRPRAAFALPLGTPRLTAGVAAAALLLVDDGRIGATPGYGAGSALGFDGELALTVRPRPWLYLRARGRYSVVSLGFNGGGANARSALDQVFDGGIEIGYSAR